MTSLSNILSAKERNNHVNKENNFTEPEMSPLIPLEPPPEESFLNRLLSTNNLQEVAQLLQDRNHEEEEYMIGTNRYTTYKNKLNTRSLGDITERIIKERENNSNIERGS